MSWQLYQIYYDERQKKEILSLDSSAAALVASTTDLLLRARDIIFNAPVSVTWRSYSFFLGSSKSIDTIVSISDGSFDLLY